MAEFKTCNTTNEKVIILFDSKFDNLILTNRLYSIEAYEARKKDTYGFGHSSGGKTMKFPALVKLLSNMYGFSYVITNNIITLYYPTPHHDM